MKHLKLGKIQWIALLVVSAMFVNLCTIWYWQQQENGNDQAQETTETTTASESTTETTTTQQEETQSVENISILVFFLMIMTLIVQNIKRERQQISVLLYRCCQKRKESWNESRDRASKTIWRCHL